MDEVRRLSIPREIYKWRAKHRSSKDLVGFLWTFSKRGDQERGLAEVHQSDESCIEGCGMPSERELRRGVLECRYAGYLMRAEVDGKPGFRLYWPPEPAITAPECASFSGHQAPDTGRRSQDAGHQAPQFRSQDAAIPVTGRRSTTREPERPKEPDPLTPNGGTADVVAETAVSSPPAPGAEFALSTEPAVSVKPKPKPSSRRPRMSAREKADDRVRKARERQAEIKAGPLYPSLMRILAAFNREVRERAGMAKQGISEKWIALASDCMENQGKSVEDIERMIECLGITIEEQQQRPGRTIHPSLIDINLIWGVVLPKAFEDHSSKLSDDDGPARRDVALIF